MQERRKLGKQETPFIRIFHLVVAVSSQNSKSKPNVFRVFIGHGVIACVCLKAPPSGVVKLVRMTRCRCEPFSLEHSRGGLLWPRPWLLRICHDHCLILRIVKRFAKSFFSAVQNCFVNGFAMILWILWLNTRWECH